MAAVKIKGASAPCHVTRATSDEVFSGVPIVLLLIVVCLVGAAASAKTSTYVFLPDQSKLEQSGGIAGVHWTYSIKGHFQLTVDPNAGTASFAHVDANATDDSPFKRTLDLNHVFNMTSLLGTVEPSGSIKFAGKAADDSDIGITLTLQNGLAHLVGQTTPPPNSADFFIFSLDAVAQRKYGGGSGTVADPYQVATAEDLINLGETPEDYDKHFILTADIDLAGRVFDKAVIAPGTGLIGWDFRDTPFTGLFDGSGHTISHLTIRGGGYLGLFGKLSEGAEVKNLGVVDVNITSSGNCVGGLAGDNWYGTVIQCYSTGAVDGNDSVGGLVGTNVGRITSSHAAGSTKGDGNVGGLVGTNGGCTLPLWICAPFLPGVISNCHSTGVVGGEVQIGGLVGVNLKGNVFHCYSTSMVTGTLFSIGGLVGNNLDSVTNCYSTGVVNGKKEVGGLVGLNQGSITMSYAIGAVDGNDYVGGLVGYGDTNDVIESFWDIEASGHTMSAGGTDKTTAEMQTAKTFLEAGWDFVNIWGIGEGQTYPYLHKYSAADINQDASVNFLDLAALAENWLADISYR